MRKQTGNWSCSGIPLEAASPHLLAEDYAKITLVDIRYLPVERIGNYIDFKDQNVLFLYSTSVLNHSETLK